LVIHVGLFGKYFKFNQKYFYITGWFRPG